MTGQREHEARRSSMFFESDLFRAADAAAFEMEQHGLRPEQVDALAEKLGDTIRDFFADREAARNFMLERAKP